MKTLTAFLIISAASLGITPVKAETITTVTVVSVNGQTATDASGDAEYTGPYGLQFGAFNGNGPVEAVWCGDDRISTGIDVPYTATVSYGDTGIPGFTQAQADTILAIIVEAVNSGNPNNPVYQETIWNLVDPAGWPTTAGTSDVLALAGTETIFPTELESITAPNEQPFFGLAVPANAPEPGTFVLIGGGLVAMGFVRRRVRA